MGSKEMAMCKALKAYRERGKPLFVRMYPKIPGNNTLAINFLKTLFEDAGERCLKNFDFDTANIAKADIVKKVMIALQMPAKVVYDPIGIYYYMPDEATFVLEFQRVFRDFCGKVAEVAGRVESPVENELRYANEVMKMACRERLGCTAREAHVIANTLLTKSGSLNADILLQWSRLKAEIDELIAGIDQQLKVVLDLLHDTRNQLEMAEIVRCFAKETIYDMAMLVKHIALYCRRSSLPGYEAYDVSSLRNKFEKLMRIRFMGDVTKISECEDHIDGFFYELESGAIIEATLVEGLPGDCHRLYEWLMDESGKPLAQAGAAKGKGLGANLFKFAGKTLKRKDGTWIRIEKDGVTLTCLTKYKDGVRSCSYTMPNATQAEFLKPLLECFKDGTWYKPESNKSVWQGKYFKRCDALKFLKDNHIEHWQSGLEGGGRGEIRLAVAKMGA